MSPGTAPLLCYQCLVLQCHTPVPNGSHQQRQHSASYTAAQGYPSTVYARSGLPQLCIGWHMTSHCYVMLPATLFLPLLLLLPHPAPGDAGRCEQYWQACKQEEQRAGRRAGQARTSTFLMGRVYIM
jgi:hypothetical protein